MVLTIPLMADLVPRLHLGKATGALAAAAHRRTDRQSCRRVRSRTCLGRAPSLADGDDVCAALAVLPFIRKPSEGARCSSASRRRKQHLRDPFGRALDSL